MQGSPGRKGREWLTGVHVTLAALSIGGTGSLPVMMLVRD